MSDSASGRETVVREQDKRPYKRNSPSLPPLSGEHLVCDVSGVTGEITGFGIFVPPRHRFRKSLCRFLSSPCGGVSRHDAVASRGHDHSSVPVHTRSGDRSCFLLFFHIWFHFTLAHESVTRFRICLLCQTVHELQPAFWRELGQYNVFVVREFSHCLFCSTQGCCKRWFLNFTFLSKWMFRCLIRKQTI